MANVDNPHGFQYVSKGCPYPPLVRTYEKQVGQATAIFQNDVVHQIAGVTGFNKAPIEPFGTGTPGTTIPLGASLNYGAALTRTRHHVIVDTQAEFEAQDDDDTDGLVAANMGLNALVSTGTGSATTGFSGHEIDEAGIVTSATAADVKLIGLYPDPNNVFGEHARILCKFLRLKENQNTAGV
jgi:hypothetical protein